MSKFRLKCGSCGAIYESDSEQCPLCDAKKNQIRLENGPAELEKIIAPKGKQKYISRYKKGRPLFKKKS